MRTPVLVRIQVRLEHVGLKDQNRDPGWRLKEVHLDHDPEKKEAEEERPRQVGQGGRG